MSNYTLGGVAVALTCLFAIIVNIFTLIVFSKRKRLHRRAHLIPLFHVAVVDLLAVITWSLPSVVIGVGDWSPSEPVCQAHAYFRSLWNTLHSHTLAVLAVERAVRLAKPSRHVIIFVPRMVGFLLCGVWVFDVLLSAVPHFGWLEFQLVTREMQCVADYTDSTRLLDFDLTVKWGLPYLAVILPCCLLAFCKVFRARDQAAPSGEIILETLPGSTGSHAYTEKVTAFQNRFKEAGMKHAKPRLGDKLFTDQGYVTDSDSDVNDVTAKELRAPRKVHSLARREYALLKTYVIISCVYVALWLPHIVLTFLVNYRPLTANVPDWLMTVVTCLTHCTHFVLPIVYLTCNRSFRRCTRKTLCC